MHPGTAAFVIVYLIIGTFALGGVSAAPWVPTRKGQRERLLRDVPVKDGAKIYDLGCGDGTVLFALAERHPGMRGVGYEIAVLPLVIGLLRKLAGGARYRGVSLRWRDLFGRDISDADVVFVFLLRESYPRLTAKLAKELRDDAVVVAEAWPFPGVTPERTVPGDRDLLPVYFYTGAGLRAATA